METMYHLIHALVKNTVDQEIKEYSLAVQENIDAQRVEVDAMLRKKQARHKLYLAKQALMSKEKELLEI